MLKINEALKHEIDLVLTDPDSSISSGARRALNYIKKSLEALAQPVGPEPAQHPDGHPNSPTYGHLKLPHLN